MNFWINFNIAMIGLGVLGLVIMALALAGAAMVATVLHAMGL